MRVGCRPTRATIVVDDLDATSSERRTAEREWGLRTVGNIARICRVTNSKIDAKNLSADERLDLLEQIWDSLEVEDVPLTDAQRAELDRRIEAMDRDGKRGIPWAEVMDRIRGRSK